jgi:hypothetical protein
VVAVATRQRQIFSKPTAARQRRERDFYNAIAAAARRQLFKKKY